VIPHPVLNNVSNGSYQRQKVFLGNHVRVD